LKTDTFYRRRHRIYLVQDNASYHKKQETHDWFQANRRYVEVLPLPPYWPELNATERVWNHTRKHVTHNRFYERPQDLCARRSFTGSITYHVIRKSSAAYFIPFLVLHEKVKGPAI